MSKQGTDFTESDREAVLSALADEVRAKHEGRPYNEAVIMACEICLRVNARKPSHEPPHYTMSQAQNWGDEITITNPQLREQARRVFLVAGSGLIF